MKRPSRPHSELPQFFEEKQTALDLAAVTANLLYGGVTISSMHAVASLGILHSKQDLARHAEHLGSIQRPSPDELREFKTHTLMTEITTDSAKGATDAAAIIYAHAVVDSMLHNLCRICASVEPEPWLELVAGKQIKLREAKVTSHEVLERTALEHYLAALERQSMLKKADALLGAIRPISVRGIRKGFRYSRDRLISIDELRHELVHKLHFHGKVRQPLAKVRYLFETGHFFHDLLVKDYRLKTIFDSPRTDSYNAGSGKLL